MARHFLIGGIALVILSPISCSCPPPPAPSGSSQPTPASSQLIAFVSSEEGFPSIKLITTDGQKERRLMKNSAALSPAWAPGGWPLAITFLDSKKVEHIDLVSVETSRGLYLSGDGEQPDMKTFTRVKLGSRRLTKQDYNNASPAWSPDGLRLAFVSDRDGKATIYTMNADGTNARQLAKIHGVAPSWSADGRYVVFASNEDGLPSIYRINVDGTGLTRLTRDKPSSQLACSPVGDRIAYAVEHDKNHVVIYVMKSDGSEPTPLSETSKNSNFPAWSPDGERLVFVTKQDGQYTLSTQNQTHPTQVVIKTSQSPLGWPNWGRVPAETLNLLVD